tara:strand:+ start:383 stop:523 length:141 start_codon:yes stop_codon:yes gene_type:complete
MVISWLEIMLSIIIIIIAFLTGMSSSPLYSYKQKKSEKNKNTEEGS